MISQGMVSVEHNDLVERLSKRFNLEVIMVRGSYNITGQYFPDLKDVTTDWEVEIVPRKQHLKDKFDKWDDNRKKVLVLKINSFASEVFDEVYVYDEINDKLILLHKK